MPAAKYNLLIEQGATFWLQLTWTIDDLPVDLTGYVARLQIREDYDSASPLVSLTSIDGGGITLNGTGTIEIEIEHDVTASLTAGKHVYDLELESPGGEVYRLIAGRATVTPRATKATT